MDNGMMMIARIGVFYQGEEGLEVWWWKKLVGLLVWYSTFVFIYVFLSVESYRR